MANFVRILSFITLLLVVAGIFGAMSRTEYQQNYYAKSKQITANNQLKYKVGSINVKFTSWNKASVATRKIQKQKIVGHGNGNWDVIKDDLEEWIQAIEHDLTVPFYADYAVPVEDAELMGFERASFVNELIKVLHQKATELKDEDSDLSSSSSSENNDESEDESEEQEDEDQEDEEPENEEREDEEQEDEEQEDEQPEDEELSDEDSDLAAFDFEQSINGEPFYSSDEDVLIEIDFPNSGTL